MRFLSLRLILSVVGIIVLLILISLVQEMNRRLQVQREIAQLEAEVKKLEKSTIAMESLNQYFRTDAFQERMAREKLNYSAPGETVVLLTEEAGAQQAPEQDDVEERPLSPARRWWQAFFGDGSLGLDSIFGP